MPTIAFMACWVIPVMYSRRRWPQRSPRSHSKKPQQADSDCEHARRDSENREDHTPDARRNAGRHHRTCPSGRRPGADRMAAWNLPEASFVSMHRSYRPLIGVTGRVSVGPACWPQAGPNATLPQFIASPPALNVPAVPLPAQFSRRGRGTRRADSREKWSRFPAAGGAWCGVAHGVLQVTKAGARHPKPGDNPRCITRPVSVPRAAVRPCQVTQDARPARPRGRRARRQRAKWRELSADEEAAAVAEL
jgi:hypothetical protein